ncbi:MAG: DUF3450 domain-containing protein [Bacteroidota bacterium]|nr:DUF3450 domain-containing protein [Bacteroidota bacterium]
MPASDKIPTLEDLQKEKLLAEIEKLRQETEQIKNAGPSIENLELQNQKAKAEIEKLRSETDQIKKPWYLQTSFLSIIVTILVPILTIVIAYFFGGGKDYFDAKNTQLQNHRDSLNASIRLFANRKDSLGKVNIKLGSKNTELLAATAGLKADRINLAKDTSKLNTQLHQMQIAEQRIQKSVDQLQLKNKGLLVTENKLVKNIQLAPFTVVWQKFTSKNNAAVFDELKNMIRYDTVGYKNDYLTIVHNYVDTTRNVTMKGCAYLLLYFVTGERSWKTKFFDQGDDICAAINKEKDESNFRFFAYWEMYKKVTLMDIVKGKHAFHSLSSTDRIINIRKLLSFMQKIQAHNFELNSIYTAIAANCANVGRYDFNGLPVYDDETLYYLRKPENFCILVSHVKAVNDQVLLKSSYVTSGPLTLFQIIAPKGYICIFASVITDIEAKYEYNHDLIDASIKQTENFQILKKAAVPDMYSVSGWRDWKIKNQPLIDQFFEIGNNCSASTIDAFVKE